MAAPYNIDRLSAALKPFKLHFYPELPSTNDKAIELRRQGTLFAPAIILTARQTAGRGRGSNRWFSTAGSLTVTFVLPVEEHLKPHQLPLVAGLAVRRTATELTANTEIAIKWPNDVVHAGHKLAGLLCERINQADIIGIGINVNDSPAASPPPSREPTRLSPAPQQHANHISPAPLREIGSGPSRQPHTTTLPQQATSLAAIAGRQFDLNDVLELLSRYLRQLLLARHSRPFAAFLQEYRQHDSLLGKNISVLTPGKPIPIEGTCEGVDAEGRLLLRSSNRRHTIIAGSITHR